MLGIIIGVGSVITMVAIGEGAHQRVAEQIRSLGTNLLMILPETGSTGRHHLTTADALAIRNEIGPVVAASPTVRDTVLILSGNKTWQSLLTGAGPDYFLARDWPIVAGRAFDESDVASAATVGVIGATIARGLFGDSDPVGRVIRISDVPVTVIGVLGRKGASASGRDQDDAVFVPISTARMRLFGSSDQLGREAVAYILVKVSDANLIEDTSRQISALLRQRHRLDAGDPDDFRISDPAATMAARRGATRTLTYLLLAVASVSLVVGGISIMNIMLVSVTERTREIGLRLALGARRSDIANQFMMEAIALSLVGGLLGVLYGVGAAVLVAEVADWPILVRPATILLSVGFAALVGVFFGLYPAVKASRLDPIEALRAG